MTTNKLAIVGLAYVLSQGLLSASAGGLESLSAAPEFQKLMIKSLERKDIRIANCLQTWGTMAVPCTATEGGPFEAPTCEQS